MTDKESINFEKVIEDWWDSLLNDSGRRAELRHCKSLDNVYFAPPYQSLRYDLKHTTKYGDDEKIALIAGVLSHVDSNEPKKEFPAYIAQKKANNEKEPIVSELRFKKLMSITDDNDRLFRSIIRILSMTEHKAPIGSLATGLYWWNSEITKKNWNNLYYEEILRRNNGSAKNE